MNPSSDIPVDGGLDRAFRVLASPQRRQILKLLAAEEATGETCCNTKDACGCAIADRLGLSPATVSYHMRSMMDAGLVASRKRGLWVYYRLMPGAIDALIGELATWKPTTAEGEPR